MTFLHTIYQYLFPPKRTGLVLNLTAERLSALRELYSSPNWLIYQSALDSVINLYAEQLLSSDSDAEVHRLRGFILGLRKAGTLVTELIRQQDYEDARKQQLDAGTSERESEREASFFGTRYGHRPAGPAR